MQKILRFLKFVRLIIREGKFRYTGVDHSANRKEVLMDVLEFCPDRSAQVDRPPGVTKPTHNNSLVRAVRSELAFLQNRLKSEGGHLCVPQLDLCYVRVPKAASTTISSAILHARYPRLKTHRLSPEKINYLADVNVNGRITGAEKKGIFFTVVRNPFARIVSVYREFFEDNPEDFIYEDYLFGILRHTISFREFVSKVRLIPDLLKDQHLRPQYLFIKYYHRKNIPVRVFKLEEASVWKDFLSAYSMEVERIHTSETPYDYRSYFDQKTVEIVGDLYRADISVFGYEPAYRQLQQLVRDRS